MWMWQRHAVYVRGACAKADPRIFADRLKLRTRNHDTLAAAWTLSKVDAWARLEIR